MDYWDIKDVISDIDMVKYLIAHKKMSVDMDSKPLNFPELARTRLLEYKK